MYYFYGTFTPYLTIKSHGELVWYIPFEALDYCVI